MKLLLLTILLFATSCADALDATTPEASAVLRGSFTVSNSADVQFLESYSEITGTLAIQGDGLVDVTLSSVRRARSVWLRDSPDLSVVALPGLASVGQLRVSGCPKLELLSATSLVRVEELVYVIGCNGPAESPVEMDLPQLRRIDGDVTVWSNANLLQCDAEALVGQVQAADGVGGSVNVTDNAVCI